MGLFLTVPAEDVLETAYDESEVLPFENAPLISDEVQEVAASTNEAESCAVRGQSATSCRTVRSRIVATETPRSAQARVAVVMLRSLLC